MSKLLKMISKLRFIDSSSGGYSFLELILASAIGAIILAATYASYAIVSREYDRISKIYNVDQFAVPALEMVVRDVRMAGYVAVDNNMNPINGLFSSPIAVPAPLATSLPIVINDSGNKCCDSVTVEYDDNSTVPPQRKQVKYYTLPRGTRNALYMDIAISPDGVTWPPSPGTTLTTQTLVTDYVVDFQVNPSQFISDTLPQVIDIEIVTEAQNDGLVTLNPFINPSYNDLNNTPPGSCCNYEYNFTDNRNRDVFVSTVYLRNIK